MRIVRVLFRRKKRPSGPHLSVKVVTNCRIPTKKKKPVQIHLGYLSPRHDGEIPPGQRSKLLRNLREKWGFYFRDEEVDIDWNDAERKWRQLRCCAASASGAVAPSARSTPEVARRADVNGPGLMRQPASSNKKHTVLFLAASSSGPDRFALDRESRSIQKELEQSGYRDRFEFETRWAAEPLDLLRELRKLKPTVVHLSGHCGRDGLSFQAADGRAQVVSAEALGHVFGAAGTSVKLVVLNACYNESQAEMLLAHVDCVVWMDGSIHYDAARSFAIGFYGGLGESEPVAVAYEQGRAAIDLEGLHGGDRAQLKVRNGIDAGRLVLIDEWQLSQ